jgi:hypothetical protein
MGEFSHHEIAEILLAKMRMLYYFLDTIHRECYPSAIEDQLLISSFHTTERHWAETSIKGKHDRKDRANQTQCTGCEVGKADIPVALYPQSKRVCTGTSESAGSDSRNGRFGA